MAQNANGKCSDSSVWLTREADANAFGDGFKSLMNNIPVVGGIVAGLVPDTLTANAVRTCPGATIDHTADYRQTYVLMGVVVALVALYIYLK